MSQDAQMFMQGAKGSAAVQKFALSEAREIYKDILQEASEREANEERLVAAYNLMNITGFVLWDSRSKDPAGRREIENYAKSFLKHHAEVPDEVQESFRRRQDFETVKRIAAGDQSAIEAFVAGMPSSEFVKEHALGWNTTRLAALDKESEKKQSNVIWFKKDVQSLQEFMGKHGLKKLLSLPSSDLNVVNETQRIASQADLTIVTIDSDLKKFDIFSSKSPEESTPRTKGGCFIATAAYGSAFAPDVLVLRYFRDEVLLSSPSSALMVKIYYQVSPALAKIIERSGLLKRLVRTMLLSPISKLVKARLRLS